MYINATATDPQDLYADLLAALQTNAALTGAVPSQAWVNVWQHAGGVEQGIVLRGPGLSAADQIYIGLKLRLSQPGDSYELLVYGMTGVINTALTLTGHVNVSKPVSCFLDVGPLNYWLVASGRRFVLVAKMSTIFETIYGGFFLPYGDPTQYPYPLMIGGTNRPDDNTGSQAITTWRAANEGHRHFPCGNDNSGGGGNQYYATCIMLNPVGEWKSASGFPGNGNAQIAIAPRNFGDVPSNWRVDPDNTVTSSRIGYNFVRSQQGPCFDGSYTLTPFTFIQNESNSQVFGIIDGCYNCPGQSIGAEYIVQIGGVDHLVVQDVFRTAIGDYWALKLA
jgi:hypothetical protein